MIKRGKKKKTLPWQQSQLSPILEIVSSDVEHNSIIIKKNATQAGTTTDNAETGDDVASCRRHGDLPRATLPEATASSQFQANPTPPRTNASRRRFQLLPKHPCECVCSSLYGRELPEARLLPIFPLSSSILIFPIRLGSSSAGNDCMGTIITAA